MAFDPFTLIIVYFQDGAQYQYIRQPIIDQPQGHYWKDNEGYQTFMRRFLITPMGIVLEETHGHPLSVSISHIEDKKIALQ